VKKKRKKKKRRRQEEKKKKRRKMFKVSMAAPVKIMVFVSDAV